MKPIQKCSWEERLERALLVIEGLAMHDVDLMEIAYLRKVMEQIYMVAHAGSGKCCEGGNGNPWLSKIDEIAKSLQENGFIDVEKIDRRDVKSKSFSCVLGPSNPQ